MIKEKISKRLLDVEYDLSKLPDLPSNPEVEIRRRLFNFAAETKAAQVVINRGRPDPCRSSTPAAHGAC